VPELPEVETVRRGLDAHVVGRTITGVKQLHPRALSTKSISNLDVITGATVVGTGRRGKFLWLNLDRQVALAAHLGMSGQFLIDSPDDKHTRALFLLEARGVVTELHFNDQRTFGWLSIEELIGGVPTSVRFIALDPFDELFVPKEVIEDIRRRQVSIKTAILNQHIVSGIGNIYADESLWLAKIHPERRANTLTKVQIDRVLQAAKEVMAQALKVGGTSFDELYINVNGESGYFDIALNAYGKEGEPCPRCGEPITRIKFANRSSHFCPRCQSPDRQQRHRS